MRLLRKKADDEEELLGEHNQAKAKLVQAVAAESKSDEDADDECSSMSTDDSEDDEDSEEESDSDDDSSDEEDDSDDSDDDDEDDDTEEEDNGESKPRANIRVATSTTPASSAPTSNMSKKSPGGGLFSAWGKKSANVVRSQSASRARGLGLPPITASRRHRTFASSTRSTSTARHSNKKDQQKQLYEQKLRKMESFRDHEAAREAADALGKDLEAMGYDLNCESFITKGDSVDEEVRDERYALDDEEQDEQRDSFSTTSLSRYDAPDPIEQSRIHRPSPRLVQHQPTDDESSAPIWTASMGAAPSETLSVSSFQTNTTEKLRAEVTANGADGQDEESPDDVAIFNATSVDADTPETGTDGKGTIGKGTVTRETGETKTILARKQNSKMTLHRPHSNKSKKAGDIKPEPAPSWLGVLMRSSPRNRESFSAGRTGKFFSSKHDDETPEMDSKNIDDSTNKVDSSPDFKKDKAGNNDEWADTTTDSLTWDGSKADSKVERIQPLLSKILSAEPKLLSEDETKPMPSGRELDLKRSSGSDNPGFDRVESQVSSRRPRQRHLGLQDVQYNRRPASQHRSGGALPKRHFQPPTPNHVIEGLREAMKAVAATSPSSPVYIEGLSFLGGKNNEKDQSPVSPPGSPFFGDEQELNKKLDALDDSIKEIAGTLKAHDDDDQSEAYTLGTSVKRRPNSWFPSRPHRKLAKLPVDVIDDAATNVVEVHPAQSPGGPLAKLRVFSSAPNTPNSAKNNKLTPALASSSVRVDSPKVMRESNKQNNATPLSPRPASPATDNKIDDSLEDTENQLDTVVGVKSPDQKTKKFPGKSLLKKITKAAIKSPETKTINKSQEPKTSKSQSPKNNRTGAKSPVKSMEPNATAQSPTKSQEPKADISKIPSPERKTSKSPVPGPAPEAETIKSQVADTNKSPIKAPEAETSESPVKALEASPEIVAIIAAPKEKTPAEVAELPPPNSKITQPMETQEQLRDAGPLFVVTKEEEEGEGEGNESLLTSNSEAERTLGTYGTLLTQTERIEVEMYNSDKDKDKDNTAKSKTPGGKGLFSRFRKKKQERNKDKDKDKDKHNDEVKVSVETPKDRRRKRNKGKGKKAGLPPLALPPVPAPAQPETTVEQDPAPTKQAPVDMTVPYVFSDREDNTGVTIAGPVVNDPSEDSIKATMAQAAEPVIVETASTEDGLFVVTGKAPEVYESPRPSPPAPAVPPNPPSPSKSVKSPRRSPAQIQETLSNDFFAVKPHPTLAKTFQDFMDIFYVNKGASGRGFPSLDFFTACGAAPAAMMFPDAMNDQEDSLVGRVVEAKNPTDKTLDVSKARSTRSIKIPPADIGDTSTTASAADSINVAEAIPTVARERDTIIPLVSDFTPRNRPTRPSLLAKKFVRKHKYRLPSASPREEDATFDGSTLSSVPSDVIVKVDEQKRQLSNSSKYYQDSVRRYGSGISRKHIDHILSTRSEDVMLEKVWEEIANASLVVERALNHIEAVPSADSQDNILNGLLSMRSQESSVFDDLEQSLEVLKAHADRLGVRESDLLLAVKSSFNGNTDTNNNKHNASKYDVAAAIEREESIADESVRTMTFTEELMDVFYPYRRRRSSRRSR